MKTTFRYSEAFKLKVIRELEQGKFSSCAAAGKAYGIRGSVTVQRWVRKYGKNHLIGKVVRVETADERSELEHLKARVRDLEKALADSTMDLRLEQAYVKLACKAAQIDDVDEFKKKCDGTQSMTRPKNARRKKGSR